MSTNAFIAPTGYVELNNDCEYSIDRKSTRSREEVDPKTDLAFYFDTYIVPKYGLNNINVSNVASFMKDLEMNWTKLDPEMKSKVMDIMVDGILSKNTSFKADLLAKLGNENIPQQIPPQPPVLTGTNVVESKSGFGKSSSSGISQSTILYVAVLMIILGLAFILIKRNM